MVEWATPKPTDRVLGVATGTGFTAFAFASFAPRVVATDLTANMLIQAHRLAGKRTLNNLLFSLAEAEALQFRDGVSRRANEHRASFQSQPLQPGSHLRERPTHCDAPAGTLPQGFP